MNVLDSNVEALAFNYLSFGLLTALNNLWTWLALLTAALSFWKIRSKPMPMPMPMPMPEAQTSTGPHPVALTPTVVALEETKPLTRAAVRKGVTEDVDGGRKGKFTVYYEEDMQCTCVGREGFSTALEEREEGLETEWWKKWEGLLRLRNGESENGWYTWQDLTELNGNVVRLWDGGLAGSFATESWYNNSSCINVS